MSIVVNAYRGPIKAGSNPAGYEILLASSSGCRTSDGIPDGAYRYVERTSVITHCCGFTYLWFRICLMELVGSPGMIGEATGPMSELINFGDWEGLVDGFIGPITAWKLARDFQEYQGRIGSSRMSDGRRFGKRFLGMYGAFRRAFEFASGDGVVVFV